MGLYHDGSSFMLYHCHRLWISYLPPLCSICYTVAIAVEHYARPLYLLFAPPTLRASCWHRHRVALVAHYHHRVALLAVSANFHHRVAVDAVSAILPSSRTFSCAFPCSCSGDAVAAPFSIIVQRGLRSLQYFQHRVACHYHHWQRGRNLCGHTSVIATICIAASTWLLGISSCSVSCAQGWCAHHYHHRVVLVMMCAPLSSSCGVSHDVCTIIIIA
jgi:hypothetical protein